VIDRAAALVEVLGGDVAVVAVALRAAARLARRDARPLGARLTRLIAEFEAAEQGLEAHVSGAVRTFAGVCGGPSATLSASPWGG
jgi:hypothetical protein